ncbi:hypothetical protein HK102_010136, partial [Quaeritorhiza haematococci]
VSPSSLLLLLALLALLALESPHGRRVTLLRAIDPNRLSGPSDGCCAAATTRPDGRRLQGRRLASAIDPNGLLRPSGGSLQPAEDPESITSAAGAAGSPFWSAAHALRDGFWGLILSSLFLEYHY